HPTGKSEVVFFQIKAGNFSRPSFFHLHNEPRTAQRVEDFRIFEKLFLLRPDQPPDRYRPTRRELFSDRAIDGKAQPSQEKNRHERTKNSPHKSDFHPTGVYFNLITEKAKGRI